MELICVKRQFTDFDAYCEGARGWDIDFMQLERGRFLGDILQIITPDIQLAHTDINRKMKQQGSSPAGMRTFAIPARGDVNLVWKGMPIPGNAVMIFQPDYGLDAVSFSDFDMFTFSMTVSRLHELCVAFGYHTLEEKVENADIIVCDGPLLSVLRNKLHNIRFVAPTIEHQPANDELNIEFNQQIPRLLLMNLAFGRVFNISQRRRLRDEARRHAEAFIRCNDFSQEPLMIETLCKAANVSQRTLEYAFLDGYGQTPKQYLKAYRLFRVFKELRKADPLKTSINQLANRWGFWHMGQFAADYRSMFGELPSESLNRTNCMHGDERN